jgi:hypothetical protein
VKRILLSLCLCVSIAACAPSTTLPTIRPIVTPAQTVAPIATETLIPSPTVEITPSPVATPTEDPNKLTYKDASGQEVTVELTKHVHDGKEVTEVPDERALFTYLVDNVALHEDLGEMDVHLLEMAEDSNEDLKELLAEYGIEWFPKTKGSAISSYPGTPGRPYMTLMKTGLDDGTLVIGRQNDGELFEVFVPVSPVEVGKYNYVAEYVAVLDWIVDNR